MEKLTEGFALVEGPVWIPQRGLVFSDVLNGGVFCLHSNGEVKVVFEHRRGIGGMSEHQNQGLVVSGRNISFKPFAGGDTQMLLDRDEPAGLVGFNDITTDAKGRVYAGGLGSSPVFDDGREPSSENLYMIDLDGSVHEVAQDIRLTNGLGFSPNGKILYHSDSLRRTVFCYEVHEDGTLGTKQSFAVTDKGVPDGLVVSQDGAVWVALAGGGQGVAVFSATGELQQHIEIPHPMCTSVCFGGADLQDLYIVSGSEGLDTDNGGGIFVTRTDVPGVPVAQAQIPL